MSCCAAQDSISSKRCRCSLLLRRRSRLSRASCRKSGNSLFLGCSCNCTSLFSAPVAQLDRAFGFEPKGREFESLRAHHFLLKISFDRSAVVCPESKIPVSLNSCIPTQCAPVAQLDRATGYEPVGRRFDSFRAHHSIFSPSIFSLPFSLLN